MAIKQHFDVAIIGAGPAGLCAAIYTARAQLSTGVFGILKNSNAYKAHIIENYFGFAEPISGPAFMEQGLRQAQRFGAAFTEREIVDVLGKGQGTEGQRDGGELFIIKDSELEEYSARAVIITSGLGFKPSGIKNEAPLTGKGVSFCVTCDGFFFKKKSVAVIGNTNYAAGEALQLLTYTQDVTMLSHGKKFEFSPKIEEALESRNITRQLTQRITAFQGKEMLEDLLFADGSTAKFDGVFLALGHATAADFATRLGVQRTGPQKAFLVADLKTGETNVPGIYAAGDCTGGNAQAAKSAGEGCNAAMTVIKRLKGVAAYVDYS